MPFSIVFLIFDFGTCQHNQCSVEVSNFIFSSIGDQYIHQITVYCE